MNTATQFWNQPIVVALVSIVGAAMITLIGAVFRMLNKLSKVDVQLTYLSQQITEMKSDADVMRWSNYGRAVQAGLVVPPGGSAHP
jgi:aspartokinase